MGAKLVMDFGRRAGDMFKSTYDTDADGTVDDSEKLEASSKAQVQDHTPKSHTHNESEISDLDHDALKLKGVIINDAAIGDQKVLAYDLGTERIVYIEQAPSGALLNNIQYGSITMTDLDTTNTETITTVDLDKSVMFSLGDFGTLFYVNRFCLLLQLTANDTVEASRVSSSFGDVVHCRFCVLEFASGIASSQRGRADLIGVNTIDVTINAVDVNNALVFYSGLRSNHPDDKALKMLTPELQLINNTTLRITCSSTTSNKYIGWAVLEFE